MRSQLDLRAHDSDAFVPSTTLDVPSHEPASGEWSVLRMGLACLAAIIMGVIPALVINHYRNAPSTSRVASPSPAPQAVAPPPSTATASTQPAAAAPTAPMIELDEDKLDQTHTDRVRRPSPPPPRPTKRAPPCDVYLHPHGCPH